MNQKRGGQDTPLKSQKLREAIALSIDKKNLANVILNDGSKPKRLLSTERVSDWTRRKRLPRNI